MADTLTFKVTGGRQLRRQLARLSDALAGEVLESSVVAGALLVANQWKRNARYKTGTYRRSIHVGGHTDVTPDFALGPDREAGVEYHDIGGAVVRRDYAEVQVGSDVPYGPRLEWGFVGQDRLGRTFNQPGDGAARRAFDETRDDVQREIGEATKDQLRHIARGGGRLV